MLLVNPSGKVYSVTHPQLDEHGSVFVPDGYWRDVNDHLKQYQLKDRTTKQTQLQFNSCILAVFWGWLLRLDITEKDDHWLEVKRQAKPRSHIYDPKDRVLRELPDLA